MSSVYSQILQSSLNLSELAPPIQALIARQALETKQNDVLERLLMRGDLAREIDAELSNVSAARVRAAWMSRGGRDPERVRILLEGEKRVTVLEAAAANASLDVESLRLVAAAGAGKSFPVCAALARHAAVDEDLCLTLLDTLWANHADTSSMGSNLAGPITSLLRNRPEMAKARFQLASDAGARTCYAQAMRESGAKLTPEEHSEVVAGLSKLPGVSTPGRIGMVAVGLVSELAPLAPTSANLLELEAAVVSLGVIRDRDWSSQPYRWSNALSAARTRLDSPGLVVAAVSSEPEDLRTTLERAMTNGDASVLRTLAVNPELTLEQLLSLAPWLNEDDRIRMYNAHQTEPAKLAGLLAQNPWRVSPAALAGITDPTPALIQIARMGILNNFHQLDQRFLTDEVVAAAPMSSLVSGVGAPSLLERVMKMFVEAAGESAAAWAELEGLAEATTSVGEVLATLTERSGKGQREQAGMDTALEDVLAAALAKAGG